MLTVRILVLLAFLAACTDPRPATTPPVPPPPPDRPPNAALVTGHVIDATGMRVEEAAVIVRAANAQCIATGAEVGAATDASGVFSIVAEGEAGPGCVIVEAASGGATGRTTSPAEFTSSEPRSPVEVVEVRLDPGPPLDRATAEKIMDALRSAINDNDPDAIAFVLPYINGGSESFRAGLEDMRIILGQATRFRLNEEAASRQQPRFTAELFGTTGNSLTFSINDDHRVRVHSPVIWYARHARQWVREFIARVSAGDAERLARLMTADDLEYPVDRARKLMESFRSRIDLTGGRFEFLGIDERRNVFRYRLTGKGNGQPAEEIIELVYGDGLLGLREKS